MSTTKKLIFAALICSLQSMAVPAYSQGYDESEANVRRAAECLRRIPGLIEGKSVEDISNDNAHFVVFQDVRGRIGFPRTVIRLHKGVREGTLPNIDRTRIMSCISGLARLPVPQ
jgi:hypothetical protein